ncbi:hypothetical protein Pmani_008899 [Petrolisthes manimaculis]|uniref:Uncharacterized protein n=1 Tax=Petrolisthes manimaculis TaxID=1843537 RepID=A0AAE1UDG1_9EUCA|nr:hypothetical protein Pmani_008899 [Petrolisthes manimaculis]
MDLNAETGEEEEATPRSRLRVRAANTQAKEETKGKKSRGHKRKAEVNVEKLYMQENFKEPTPSPLETIFESPKLQRKRMGKGNKGEEDTEAVTLMSLRKVKRICNFPSYYGPPKLKTKQRKDRARKLSKTTGARVPKGSGVSMEEVRAALACLSDSEEQVDENKKGFCNNSFVDSPSSEFYSGNIIRPDTSEAAMDYVIHNMSNLNVTLPESQIGNENAALLDVVTEQLLLDNPLPFDDELSGQKRASRDKRVRRRSGRVTACPSLSNELIPVSEEPPVQTDIGLVDNLPSDKEYSKDYLLPINEPCEPDEPSQNENLCRKSKKVTLCSIEGEKLSPTSEEPSTTCSLRQKHTPSDFPKTLPEKPEDMSVIPPTQEKNVKKRVKIKKTNVNSKGSAVNGDTREMAKERAKQRKPVQDTSEIAKKSQKLDLGRKRENSAKSETVFVKKSKNSRMKVDGETKSIVRGDDIVDIGTSSIVEQKAVSNTCFNARLHQSVLVVPEKGFLSKGKGDNGQSRTGKEGRRPARSKRRVSGVERPLYRISLTTIETPESSPVLSEDLSSSHSFNTSSECSQIKVNDQGTNSFALRESGSEVLWQSSLSATVPSARNMTGISIRNLESSVHTPVSGQLVQTTSPCVPTSSTSVTTTLNTQSSIDPTTTTCASSFHANKDGLKTACSPTSPSAQLAALSLQTDFLQSPATPISIPKTKKDAKRRSSRLSFDHPQISIVQATDSHLGSFWATSPALRKMELDKIITANECSSNSVIPASVIPCKLQTQNIPGVENLIPENPNITEPKHSLMTGIKKPFRKMKKRSSQSTTKIKTKKKDSREVQLKAMASQEKVNKAKTQTEPILTVIREHSEPTLTSVITNSSEPLLPDINREHYNVCVASSLVAREEERRHDSMQSLQVSDPSSEQKVTNPTHEAENDNIKCNSELLQRSPSV